MITNHISDLQIAALISIMVAFVASMPLTLRIKDRYRRKSISELCCVVAIALAATVLLRDAGLTIAATALGLYVGSQHLSVLRYASVIMAGSALACLAVALWAATFGANVVVWMAAGLTMGTAVSLLTAPRATAAKA